MATANEGIRDASIRHAIYLERLKAGTVRKYLALLGLVEADLLAQIMKGDPTTANGYSAKRLDALLLAIRGIIAAGNQQLRKELAEDLDKLAVYEAIHMRRTVTEAVMIELDVVTAAPAQLHAAVHARPFHGRLLKEWVSDLGVAQFGRVRDAIRIGVVEGETIDQITRRLRGTRAMGFKDGVLQINRRSAEAMVRTAVNHTVTEARQATFAENADVVKGVQWVSTLDGRTSPMCRARDGQVYPIDKGPRPPGHPSCRSTIVPVLKSWEELGINAKEMEPGTRASMDGQVPATETYDSWLRKQPRAFQDEVLGKARAKLFREGGLTLDKFVDDYGKQYSLAELARQEAGTETGQMAVLMERVGPEKAQRLQSAFRDQDLPNGMTEAEAAAIRYYTNKPAYRQVNPALRGVGPDSADDWKPYTELVKEGLSKLPDHKGTVYRYTDVPDDIMARYLETEVVQDRAFVSTTARPPGEWERPWTVQYVIESRTGKSIERFSQYSKEEREILYPPDMKFRIVREYKDSDKRIVYLEEIDA